MTEDTVLQSSTDTPTQASDGKGKGRIKARPKPVSEAKGKRSLNLSIPVEDYERYAVHSIRTGMTISDLFCKLGREHLREFHITRTANRATPSDS